MPQTHIIEVQTVEDMDTKYLVDVLMWGLEEHNSKVAQFEESAGSDLFADEDKDHDINPVSMTILSEEQA